MSDVHSLRAEAKRRRAAATAKAARIRRTSGAVIAGTEFDPRKPHAAVNRMNSVQLRAYINKLNTFTSRTTQFVGLHGGEPVPRKEWQGFVGRQNRVAELEEAHSIDIGRYKAMGSDETVGQARARLHPTAQGGRRGPLNSTSFDPSDINGRSALNKLDARLRKVLSPGYVKAQLKQGRANAIEALKQMGELELIEKVAALSEYQFDVLWYGTRFAEVTFARYEGEKERMEGNQKETAQNRTASEQFEIARDWLDWAATEIPRERPTPKPEATERIRGFRR
jgi:hypothetical protein